MAKHIPFVYGRRTSQLVNQFLGDSEVVRMPLQASVTVRESLPKGSKVWVDAGVDGYDRWPDVSDMLKQLPGGDELGWPSFQQKPAKEIVDGFVAAVLGKCSELGADWVSVPQLPVVGDSSRNRVNRELASAAATWKAETKFKGVLILPVVVTHQAQVNLKGGRDKRTTLVRQCFERAGADGYWVVDSSLADWTGSRTFEERRFKALGAVTE